MQLVTPNGQQFSIPEDFILRIKGLRNATTFHYDFPPSAKDFILRIKGLRNATFVSGIPRQENLFISYSE